MYVSEIKQYKAHVPQMNAAEVFRVFPFTIQFWSIHIFKYISQYSWVILD